MALQLEKQSSFKARCAAITQVLKSIDRNDYFKQKDLIQSLQSMNYGMLVCKNEIDRKMLVVCIGILLQCLYKSTKSYSKDNSSSTEGSSRTIKDALSQANFEELKGPFVVQDPLIYCTFDPSTITASKHQDMCESMKRTQLTKQDNLILTYLAGRCGEGKPIAIGLAKDRLFEILANPALFACLPDPATTTIAFNLKKGTKCLLNTLEFTSLTFTEWLKFRASLGLNEAIGLKDHPDSQSLMDLDSIFSMKPREQAPKKQQKNYPIVSILEASANEEVSPPPGANKRVRSSSYLAGTHSSNISSKQTVMKKGKLTHFELKDANAGSSTEENRTASHYLIERLTADDPHDLNRKQIREEGHDPRDQRRLQWQNSIELPEMIRKQPKDEGHEPRRLQWQNSIELPGIPSSNHLIDFKSEFLIKKRSKVHLNKDGQNRVSRSTPIQKQGNENKGFQLKKVEPIIKAANNQPRLIQTSLNLSEATQGGRARRTSVLLADIDEEVKHQQVDDHRHVEPSKGFFQLRRRGDKY